MAIESGYSHAQYWLVRMYDQGRGVPQDDAEAAKWFRLAAEQGHIGAQSDLGFAYSAGRGVPRDYVESTRWHRLAADRGNIYSQYALGETYSSGIGGTLRDLVEGMRWYRLAAEQGHAQAQYELAVGYTNGRGVPQDDLRAHKWANLSASRMTTGPFRDVVVELRDQIASRLTPDQRIEAQRLAREWDEEHPREPEPPSPLNR